MSTDFNLTSKDFVLLKNILEKNKSNFIESDFILLNKKIDFAINNCLLNEEDEKVEICNVYKAKKQRIS